VAPNSVEPNPVQAIFPMAIVNFILFYEFLIFAATEQIQLLTSDSRVGFHQRIQHATSE